MSRKKKKLLCNVMEKNLNMKSFFSLKTVNIEDETNEVVNSSEIEGIELKNKKVNHAPHIDYETLSDRKMNMCHLKYLNACTKKSTHIYSTYTYPKIFIIKFGIKKKKNI